MKEVSRGHAGRLPAVKDELNQAYSNAVADLTKIVTQAEQQGPLRFATSGLELDPHSLIACRGGRL